MAWVPDEHQWNCYLDTFTIVFSHCYLLEGRVPLDETSAPDLQMTSVSRAGDRAPVQKYSQKQPGNTLQISSTDIQEFS